MSESTYAFLDYELSTPHQILRQGGNLLNVRPKTVALLSHLILHRHRVVTKEELLEAVWPRVIVQEQAVFQSISELRSIFQDASCIETVRGCGYQWIAVTKKVRRISFRKPLFRAVAATLAISALLLGAILWSGTGRPPGVTIIIHPATVNVLSSEISGLADGVDEMLLQHFRRMGWDAKRSTDESFSGTPLELMINVAPEESGIKLQFTLSGPITDYKGSLISSTPIDAVQELSRELHPFLSLDKRISINDLFVEAEKQLDNDNFQLAEAYLKVVLAEQPVHLSARTALAYTYQMTGRLQDAMTNALFAYNADRSDSVGRYRMIGAMLLSQIFFQQERLAESDKFAREAMQLASIVDDQLIVAEAQELLGEISLAKGEIIAGLGQLTVALKFYSSFCPSGEARVSRRLFELESTMTNDGVNELL